MAALILGDTAQGKNASSQANENAEVAASSQGDKVKQSAPDKYAEVNGLRVYYEIHGSGQPLVLLHGAFGFNEGWVTIYALEQPGKGIIDSGPVSQRDYAGTKVNRKVKGGGKNHANWHPNYPRLE
jgi:hypothetical protein